MLILPFKIKNQSYCVRVDNIKEIIPIVEFERINDLPDSFCGMINYRGAVCPVIDISYLIRNTKSKFYLSTRIIIIENPEFGKEYGILAEEVTETLLIDESQIRSIIRGVPDSHFIESIVLVDNNMIQMIHLNSLFHYEIVNHFDEVPF